MWEWARLGARPQRPLLPRLPRHSSTTVVVWETYFMSALRCDYLTGHPAPLPTSTGFGKSEPFHRHAPQNVFITWHAPASSLQEPV